MNSADRRIEIQLAERRKDRERRLQNAIQAFEFEDPQDGTNFDCAFLDAIKLLRQMWT